MICSVADCARDSETRLGFCVMHYKRFKRNGTTDRVHEKQEGPCIIEGCNKPQKTRHMCINHYDNWLRYGDPTHERKLREITKMRIATTHRLLHGSTHRPRTRLRLQTHAWRTLRKKVYENDQFRCQICGKTDCRLNAHHIIPREIGGPDELWNLIAVCCSCHRKLHYQQGPIFI